MTSRLRGTPARSVLVRAAVKHGRQRAEDTLAARARRRRRGKGIPGASGVLVAEGDSWFDYPLYDVLEILEDEFNFRVESVAHKGDTLESMAYDPTQLAALDRKMEHLQRDGRMPRAILLSGGGNDIAGDEFAMLLNHHASGLPILNARIVDGVVEERLRFAFVSLLTAITALANQHFGRSIPVVVHGYAYPVPDGRGYLGGFWLLPGPWLQPGFLQKGHATLTTNAAVMVDLIDRFNAMLATLPNVPGLNHVRYVDLRSTLSNAVGGGQYKKSWENELHPSQPGFRAVAREVNDVVKSL